MIQMVPLLARSTGLVGYYIWSASVWGSMILRLKQLEHRKLLGKEILRCAWQRGTYANSWILIDLSLSLTPSPKSFVFFGDYHFSAAYHFLWITIQNLQLGSMNSGWYLHSKTWTAQPENWFHPTSPTKNGTQSPWMVGLDGQRSSQICKLKTVQSEFLVGGPGPPLWKIWVRQLGWWFPIYGKIKNGNQTTNQIWKGQWNVQHCTATPQSVAPVFPLNSIWQRALLNITPCELENMSVLQKYLAQFLKESSGFFITQVSIQRFLRHSGPRSERQKSVEQIKVQTNQTKRIHDKLSPLNQRMSIPNAGIVGPYQVNNFRLEGRNFWPGWSLTREVEDHTGTCEHHHLQGVKTALSWKCTFLIRYEKVIVCKYKSIYIYIYNIYIYVNQYIHTEVKWK